MNAEQSHQVTYRLNRKLPLWARKPGGNLSSGPPPRRLGPRGVHLAKNSRKPHQAPEIEEVEWESLAQLLKVLIGSLNIRLNLQFIYTMSPAATNILGTKQQETVTQNKRII